MGTNTLVWTELAVVAAVVVVTLVFIAQRTLAKRQRWEAEQAHRTSQREAISDEDAANARGVKAQAKAAIVARLRRGAATRRREALAEVDDEREPTTGRQSA